MSGLDRIIACQADAYAQTFSTRVLSCVSTPVSGGMENAKKPAKGGKQEAKTEIPATFDIELEDTVLFPEGGGQPSDTGFLITPSARVTVLTVQRVGGKVIHRCDQPLEVDTQVQQQVDWSRRYDHMQQHSSQHLISAIALRNYQYKTVSWWLATAPAECHIEMDTPEIPRDSLLAIESECNRLIRVGLDLSVHVYNNLDHARQDSWFTENVKKMPTEHAGPLRVVNIPDVDVNTCCGTHLKKTSEMQLIHVTRTEKSKTNTKLFFLSGNRALQALSTSLDIQRKLTATLTTTPDQHVAAAAKLQADARVANKLTQKLQTELAELLAQSLAEQAKTSQFVHLHRSESTGAFITAVGDAFISLSPALCLLTCSDDAKESEGQFLFLSSDKSRENDIKTMGAEIAKIMEGRGGGRAGRFQGKVARVSEREKAYQYARKTLESS